MLWLVVIAVAMLFSPVGKNIYGIFFPDQLGEGFFEVLTPGIIEGFIFVYLFLLALLFIPVFQPRPWRMLIIPALLVFLPVALFWQIALFAVIFFVGGTALGYLAVWLRKKL